MPINYPKRFVAFIDILGFSSLVQDSVNNLAVREKVQKALETVYSTSLAEDDDDPEFRAVTTFSDSVVISYNDDAACLLMLLQDVSRIQFELAAIGILTRGGIALGECYHDSKMVFGPAMVEAYHLESKIAKSPRVVVPKECVDRIVEYTDEFISFMNRSAIMCHLRGDEDLYYIDYLRVSNGLSYYGEKYMTWLHNFRRTLIEQIKILVTKPADIRVLDKYVWLLKYWNNTVGEYTAEEDCFDMNLAGCDDQCWELYWKEASSLKITEFAELEKI